MIVFAFCCLFDGRFGSCRSTSSSVLSVARVGEVRIEAAEEPGSMLAMLLLMLGTDTLDRVRNGHLGGTSGATAVFACAGLLERSLLGRGVSISSSVPSRSAGGVMAAVLFGKFVVAGVVLGLDNGDFFSDTLRSLPFPNTAFRRDPFRFREDFD